MPVSTSWMNPTSAGMDINNNQPWTETVVDNYASDLYRLGGTDGNAKTGPLKVGTGGDTYLSTYNTTGLVVEIGTVGGEALTLKASGAVAHGVTTLAETDTYTSLKPAAATGGGLEIRALAESTEENALHVVAVAGIDATGKVANSNAYTVLNNAKVSGTGTTSPGANANLLAVRGGFANKLIVDQDGDLHVDGATSLAGFDGDDDLALVEGARLLMMRGQPEGYRADFARNLDAAKDTLAAAGVLSLNPDGSVAMVSLKGLFALLMDTVRQEGYRLRALEERVAPLLSVEARPYG